MSPKKDPVLAALADCPEKWNTYLLKTYGYPETPQPRAEVSESAFVREDRSRIPLESVAASQIRFGEEAPRGLFKVQAEPSNVERKPTEQWIRSQAFLRVMAQIYAHEYKQLAKARAQLLKIVDDLRPEELLVEFPEGLGTPEEFFYCWQHHEYEVEFIRVSRKLQRIQIWQIQIPFPPEEPDDDEPGEPCGEVFIGKSRPTRK